MAKQSKVPIRHVEGVRRMKLASGLNGPPQGPFRGDHGNKGTRSGHLTSTSTLIVVSCIVIVICLAIVICLFFPIVAIVIYFSCVLSLMEPICIMSQGLHKAFDEHP